MMRPLTLVLTLMLATSIAVAATPFAQAKQDPPQCFRPCGPIVDVCLEGVTDPTCWPGGDVCVYAFSWVPRCEEIPCWGDGCIVVTDPCEAIGRSCLP